MSSFFEHNYGAGLNRDVRKIVENSALLNQGAGVMYTVRMPTNLTSTHKICQPLSINQPGARWLLVEL